MGDDSAISLCCCLNATVIFHEVLEFSDLLFQFYDLLLQSLIFLIVVLYFLREKRFRSKSLCRHTRVH